MLHALAVPTGRWCPCRGKQVWPSPDVMTNMGAKDALCKIANLGIGLIDTFAYYSPEEFAAGFKKTMAFQPRVIKQNRGSSGEGIWIIKLKSENYCHLACLRLSFFSQLNVYFEGKPNSNQNKKYIHITTYTYDYTYT